MKRLFLAMVMAAMTTIMFSCDGSDGGGEATVDTPEYAVTSITEQTEQPKYEGFDLGFRQADYWRYDWEKYVRTESYFNPNMNFTFPAHDRFTTGTILITLGEPKTIMGITFYQVLTEHSDTLGHTGGTPIWSHIASFNNKIFGYKDDWVYLLFDAQNGSWEGGLFFHGTANNCFSSFSSEKTFEISPTDDDYEIVCPSGVYGGGKSRGATETYRPFTGPIEYANWHRSPEFRIGRVVSPAKYERLKLTLVESSR